MVEAHVCIEPLEIYEILKALRRTAGYPPPALGSVNQGLQDLRDVHAQAAIAGFKRSQDAIEPVQACTEQILALNERYQIEVLGRLLVAYRQSIAQQQSVKIQQIEGACEALQQQPTSPASLEALTKALLDWASLCRPLTAFDTHQGFRERDAEIPADLVRKLVAHLTAHQQYDVALKVANSSRDLLSSMPTMVDQLDKDIGVIERLSLDARMKPLEDFIDGLHNDFELLNQALKRDGFGQNATGTARSLWDEFVRVVEVTDPRKSAEPWMLIRDLAIHFSDNLGDAAAATALVGGLISYGEKVSALPSMLDALRDDLRRIESEHHIGERPAKPDLKRLARLTGFALAACGAIGLYLGFDRARVFWSSTLAGSTAEFASTAADAEIKPPVGGGQHFSLGNVRYCHFQEERLRIMKQQARGPEDIRAFNLLVVDYNSRCADFFYRDEDVAAVAAELAANRQRLAAEAERIMTTWPGRAAATTSAK